MMSQLERYRRTTLPVRRHTDGLMPDVWRAQAEGAEVVEVPLRLTAGPGETISLSRVIWTALELQAIGNQRVVAFHHDLTEPTYDLSRPLWMPGIFHRGPISLRSESACEWGVVGSGWILFAKAAAELDSSNRARASSPV